MNTFKLLLDGMNEFDTLCTHIRKKKGFVHALGLSSSQKNHLVYALAEHTDMPCVVVVPDELEAGRTLKELSFLS